MKIRSIHIYSHNGQRRDLRFKVDGLTARTLTAKETNNLTAKIMEYVNGT